MAHFGNPRALAVFALAATLAAVSACSSNKPANGNGALTGETPTVSPTPPTASTTATLSPTAAASTASSTTVTVTSTGTSVAASGPKLSFVMTQKPSCPVFGDGTDAPFTQAGSDIKLKWSTSGGVKKVALSLDSPGFFQQYGTGSIDTYAPDGSVDLAFQCDPTVLPNTTHKYTLDTIGGGKTIEKTITVTVQTDP